MQTKVSRRDFFQVAGGISLATLLSGCFGVGTSQSTTSASSTKTITIWDIRIGKDPEILKQITDQFNTQHPDIHANLQFLQGEAAKQKLSIAMGAHRPPDIFIGYGGGILKAYIDAGDVYDLTSAFDQDPGWKNKFFPSVMQAVTFNNKIYAVPNSFIQPVVFFYNKELFSQYKLTPPQTWNDLLNAVKTLKQHNVLPIALGGVEKWPYLMYEQYLVDRIGGPKALNAVIANEANAWSNQAFITANTLIQELVSAGAFGPNFASVSYLNGQASALLFTGKAAMHLMGAWEFGSILANSPDFIQSSKLGWFAFPAVENGKGDPKNLAGNVCTFYSIAKDSKEPQACLTYLKNAVLNDDEITKFIAVGEVPPVQGIASKLNGAPHSDWLQFIYTSVQNAPHYQLSWDQALSPQPAQALLTNLDQLFLKQSTPQQFSVTMNQTLS